MNSEFFDALDALEKEKGIPKDYMIEKVEAALLAAFKSEYKKESGGNTNVKVTIDSEKKSVHMYRQRTVVEEVTNPFCEISLDDAKLQNKRADYGTVVDEELKTKNFGRISAQTAKQVIIQAIREAERGLLIQQYESKKEEILTAHVLKTDPLTGNATLEVGNGELMLPKTEQIPGETLNVGDYIKVYLAEVKKENRGPMVTISRTHAGLVKRLFELEVPEIRDGIVLIRGIAREAGSRTKMAVSSQDPDVDPIGACIGARGARINTIVSELNGEKIDIIKYSDKPEEYVKLALSPATVTDVTMTGEKACRVIVPDDQLSLAIGKEGQNARLTARLTGFKIDIKTGNEPEPEEEI